MVNTLTGLRTGASRITWKGQRRGHRGQGTGETKITEVGAWFPDGTRLGQARHHLPDYCPICSFPSGTSLSFLRDTPASGTAPHHGAPRTSLERVLEPAAWPQPRPGGTGHVRSVGPDASCSHTKKALRSLNVLAPRKIKISEEARAKGE